MELRCIVHSGGIGKSKAVWSFQDDLPNLVYFLHVVRERQDAGQDEMRRHFLCSVR